MNGEKDDLTRNLLATRVQALWVTCTTNYYATIDISKYKCKLFKTKVNFARTCEKQKEKRKKKKEKKRKQNLAKQLIYWNTQLSHFGCVYPTTSAIKTVKIKPHMWILLPLKKPNQRIKRSFIYDYEISKSIDLLGIVKLE